jgi:nitrate/TMAO reductase-like tetraheme cytochrome c subunit
VSEAIIVALISLVGTVITCYATNRKTRNDLTQKFEVSQAVMQTEIKELTREVREHNNFAKRMPVVENEIVHLVDDVHKLQSYHN